MLSAMRLTALLFVVGLCLAERTEAQEASAEQQSTEQPSAEQLAEARELFDDGLRYVQDRLFGRAAIAFRRAAAIKPAPAVLYNLAAAEYELGELVEAATHARQVIEAESAPADLVERARSVFENVRPQIGMLTVRTGGAADEATLDGESLAPEQLGRALLVAPGAHTVVVLRGGEPVAERTVEIAAGVQAHVDITVVPSAEAVAVAAVAAEEAPQDSHRVNRWQLGVIVGGSGLLLTIITAIIVFAAAG